MPYVVIGLCRGGTRLSGLLPDNKPLPNSIIIIKTCNDIQLKLCQNLVVFIYANVLVKFTICMVAASLVFGPGSWVTWVDETIMNSLKHRLLKCYLWLCPVSLGLTSWDILINGVHEVDGFVQVGLLQQRFVVQTFCLSEMHVVTKFGSLCHSQTYNTICKFSLCLPSGEF